MNIRVKNTVKFLPLILFVWYFCSANLLTHEHIIDGKKVAHSHAACSNDHQHSINEFTIIYLLTHFNSTKVVGFVAMLILLGVILILTPIPIERNFLSPHLKSYSLRGPPLF